MPGRLLSSLKCSVMAKNYIHDREPSVRGSNHGMSNTFHPTKVVFMKSLIVLLALAASMAGCAVYTPRGAVVIDPAGPQGSGGGGGKFCPPGQAKKGNC